MTLLTVAELDGQPIEQFRMRGPLTPHAEILGGFDQPHAEQHLPEAIDCDPAGKRVRWMHEPPSQAEPVVRCTFRQRRQRGGHAARHLFAWGVVCAALKQERLAWSLTLAHHHYSWETLFEFSLLLLQLIHPLPR